MEAVVRDMAHGGDAVAVGPLGVVLVAGAAPGERVRLEDVRKARGVLRGRLAEVLDPSPDRVVPPCPLVAACGGCPWMHLSAAAQARLKAGFVRDALARAGHDAGDGPVFHPAPAALHGRRRARLHYAGGALGWHGRRSDRVVDAAECPVLSAPLQAALTAVRADLLPALRAPGGPRRAEVSLSEGPAGASVVLRTDGDPAPPVYAACATLAGRPGVGGVALAGPSAAAPAVFGDPRDAVGGVVGPPGGFSQADEAGNALLVEVVARLSDTAGLRVLELYCGAGNLTVALAPGARSYVAIEADRAAAQACQENLRERGVAGVKVVAADADRPVACRPEVLVLDPPRAGARQALAWALKGRPGRVVYVSCDPPTLSRDLADLRAAGYAAVQAHAFDLFPQTAHVEAVVALERRT